MSINSSDLSFIPQNRQDSNYTGNLKLSTKFEQIQRPSNKTGSKNYSPVALNRPTSQLMDSNLNIAKFNRDLQTEKKTTINKLEDLIEDFARHDEK